MPVHKTSLIHVHTQAPAKPVWGAPCNGCGVCCLSEPCPLGMVLSGRRQGACVALRWDEAGDAGGVGGSYRCGVLQAPQAVLQQVLPGWLRWTVPGWLRVLRWRGARWIGAGRGCDCSLVVTLPGATGPHARATESEGQSPP